MKPPITAILEPLFSIFYKNILFIANTKLVLVRRKGKIG